MGRFDGIGSSEVLFIGAVAESVTRQKANNQGGVVSCVHWAITSEDQDLDGVIDLWQMMRILIINTNQRKEKMNDGPAARSSKRFCRRRSEAYTGLERGRIRWSKA